jgi:SAM-dependent methyltransferase
LQEELSGAYSGGVTAQHRAKAVLVSEHCGRTRRVLELGAGGGQMAVAMAELGFAVDAIELVPRLAAHARELASAQMEEINIFEGNFYVVALDGPYGAVTYWDGFGIGSDSDQHALLRRIRRWLADGGRALIDVYTPWYWARVAGREVILQGSHRRYDFNTETRTMIDTWWPAEAPDKAASQHLRCYEPDELEQLLSRTDLSLETIVPGGEYDPDKAIYREQVALEDAMSYTAIITV